MTESAALLVDEVLRRQPLRQGGAVATVCAAFLLATDPKVLSQVLGIACRGIASHLINLDSLGHMDRVARMAGDDRAVGRDLHGRHRAAPRPASSVSVH